MKDARAGFRTQSATASMQALQVFLIDHQDSLLSARQTVVEFTILQILCRY